MLFGQQCWLLAIAIYINYIAVNIYIRNWDSLIYIVIELVCGPCRYASDVMHSAHFKAIIPASILWQVFI